MGSEGGGEARERRGSERRGVKRERGGRRGRGREGGGGGKEGGRGTDGVSAYTVTRMIQVNIHLRKRQVGIQMCHVSRGQNVVLAFPLAPLSSLSSLLVRHEPAAD